MAENAEDSSQSQPSSVNESQPSLDHIDQPATLVTPVGKDTTRKRTQSAGPQSGSKISAKKQKKNASTVKKEEEDRVKQISAKIEGLL